MNESRISTDNSAIDALYPRIRGFMEKSVVEYDMMGKKVRGYRTPDAPSIWIRDYSDMMRGFRYWEKDLRSIVEHFAETQCARGWFFDYFTMTPEKVPCERENWAKYVRVPVEADVEYRFVKAVFLAWQSTGDDDWMRGMIPVMEKAMAYITSDPLRWDAKLGLVKRAYTIDTWDFDYTAGREPWLNFRMTDDTFWGIMHGDNSGYVEAFALLSIMHRALGNVAESRAWKSRAAFLKRRANDACFNGRFYRHFVPLSSVKIPGANERRQLSLSNPMDVNRGMASHEMAVSIIREYVKRGSASGAFAPWFSIDPPFPDGVFGDAKLVGGAYCNGGIMPLVGGELARAAFEHGREDFAVRQLLAYETLTQCGESFLWYFPDGRHATIETSTSPDASPTDSWGSSAMLYALMEGLAGVVDLDRLFRRVRLSPRWCACASMEASVNAVYAASGAGIGYRFEHDAASKTIRLDFEGEARIDLHLLLPRGTRARSAVRDGRTIQFRNTFVEASPYMDAKFRLDGVSSIEVRYGRGEACLATPL
jgi:hypothetical protein